MILPFDVAVWTTNLKKDQLVDGVILTAFHGNALSRTRITKTESLKGQIVLYAKGQRLWYKKRPSLGRFQKSSQKKGPNSFVSPAFQKIFGRKPYSILSG